MNNGDRIDYRDEGIGYKPISVHLNRVQYHEWTEPLGLLLHRTLGIEDPRTDHDIVRCVELIEAQYPALVGQVWRLVESAKNPVCHRRSAKERLIFYANDPDQDVLTKHYAWLPLNEIELHDLIQGERV